MPARKAQNIKITVFPPFPQPALVSLALNPVHLARPPISTQGRAGSSRYYFSIFWGWLQSLREELSGARASWWWGEAPAQGRFGKRLEAELAGLMNGDLAAGKVSPAQVRGGRRVKAQETLPRLPASEGASHTPCCTDGETEAQREHRVAKLVPPSWGCSCLCSRRGNLGRMGG